MSSLGLAHIATRSQALITFQHNFLDRGSFGDMRRDDGNFAHAFAARRIGSFGFFDFWSIQHQQLANVLYWCCAEFFSQGFVVRHASLTVITEYTHLDQTVCF